jgi:hypothetical protein
MDNRTLIQSMENCFKDTETEKVMYRMSIRSPSNVNCTVSGTFDSAEDAVTFYNEIESRIEVIIDDKTS